MSQDNQNNANLFSSRLNEAISRQTKYEKLPDGKYKGTAHARIESVKGDTPNYGRKKLVVYLRVTEGAEKGKVDILDWVLNPAHLDVAKSNTPDGLKAHDAMVKNHFDTFCKILNNLGIETFGRTEDEIFGEIPIILSEVEFNVANTNGSHRIYINKLIRKGYRPESGKNQADGGEENELKLYDYMSDNEAPLGSI